MIILAIFGYGIVDGLSRVYYDSLVLVRTFWEEGRIDEAVEVVRDMESRGVVGTASVYYELACCLSNKGRWKDALLEVCVALLYFRFQKHK